MPHTSWQTSARNRPTPCHSTETSLISPQLPQIRWHNTTAREPSGQTVLSVLSAEGSEVRAVHQLHAGIWPQGLPVPLPRHRPALESRVGQPIGPRPTRSGPGSAARSGHRGPGRAHPVQPVLGRCTPGRPPGESMALTFGDRTLLPRSLPRSASHERMVRAWQAAPMGHGIRRRSGMKPSCGLL
jgi:hypothetical protein